MYINLTWNCRICVGVAFLCLLCAFLPNPYHFLANWPTTPSTVCEDKDWVHSFTLKLDCHNSYNKWWLCNSANCDLAWCNENNSECFFWVLKKPKTCFIKKNGFKKSRRVVFFKWRVFLNPDYLSILFWDFSLIAQSGTSHAAVSLNGCAAHI